MKDRLIYLFGEEWYSKLEPFLTSKKFMDINRFIATERSRGKIIFPEVGSDDNFRCYRLTQPKDIKVIIIANPSDYSGNFDGLCLSGSKLIEENAILKLILHEVNRSYPDNETNLLSGLDLFDLSRWAKQGVFLLSPELTFQKDRPLDHLPIWNELIITTIKVINSNPYTCWVMIGENNWTFQNTINILHRKITIKNPVTHPSEIMGLFSDINQHLRACNKKEIIF